MLPVSGRVDLEWLQGKCERRKLTTSAFTIRNLGVGDKKEKKLNKQEKISSRVEIN